VNCRFCLFLSYPWIDGTRANPPPLESRPSASVKLTEESHQGTTVLSESVDYHFCCSLPFGQHTSKRDAFPRGSIRSLCLWSSLPSFHILSFFFLPLAAGGVRPGPPGKFCPGQMIFFASGDPRSSPAYSTRPLGSYFSWLNLVDFQSARQLTGIFSPKPLTSFFLFLPFFLVPSFRRSTLYVPPARRVQVLSLYYFFVCFLSLLLFFAITEIGTRQIAEKESPA